MPLAASVEWRFPFYRVRMSCQQSAIFIWNFVYIPHIEQNHATFEKISTKNYPKKIWYCWSARYRTHPMGILSRCRWISTELLSMVFICISFILPAPQRKTSQKTDANCTLLKPIKMVTRCRTNDIYWGSPFMAIPDTKCEDWWFVRIKNQQTIT